VYSSARIPLEPVQATWPFNTTRELPTIIHNTHTSVPLQQLQPITTQHKRKTVNFSLSNNQTNQSNNRRNRSPPRFSERDSRQQDRDDRPAQDRDYRHQDRDNRSYDQDYLPVTYNRHHDRDNRSRSPERSPHPSDRRQEHRPNNNHYLQPYQDRSPEQRGRHNPLRFDRSPPRQRELYRDITIQSEQSQFHEPLNPFDLPLWINQVPESTRDSVIAAFTSARASLSQTTTNDIQPSKNPQNR